jgi:hypothetical protein
VNASIFNQRLFAWSGILGIVVLLIGQWVIAGFVPPPGPDKSMQEIVDLYVRDQDSIRIGLIIACFGAVWFGPWSIAIAVQMKRIEGTLSPLAWLQVAFGALLVFEFFVPVMMWQAAAFRPEFDPQFTYRLHDLASITYVGLPMTAMLQTFALGLAVLQDKREVPVFPRWLAYLSFWAGLGFAFGALNPLAHDGPVAWNGVLAWWLGLSIFGVWIIAVTHQLLTRAIPSCATEP